MVRQFLPTIDHWQAIPGTTKYSKGFGSIAILFIFCSIPAIFIMVTGKIHLKCIFGESMIIILQELPKELFRCILVFNKFSVSCIHFQV